MGQFHVFMQIVVFPDFGRKFRPWSHIRNKSGSIFVHFGNVFSQVLHIRANSGSILLFCESRVFPVMSHKVANHMFLNFSNYDKFSTLLTIMINFTPSLEFINFTDHNNHNNFQSNCIDPQTYLRGQFSKQMHQFSKHDHKFSKPTQP